MALRPIITLPDPKLRLVSQPVERIDGELRSLMDDMIETMHDAPGIGLAAIQIALPIRLLVVDIAKGRRKGFRRGAGAGPARCSSIRRSSGRSDERSVYEEGCLSIPEYFAEVERPASIRVRHLDREGRKPGDSRRRPARDRAAARDRPSRRRSVHRPPLEAQARPGDQEVPEGRQEDGRRIAHALNAAPPR